MEFVPRVVSYLLHAVSFIRVRDENVLYHVRLLVAYEHETQASGCLDNRIKTAALALVLCRKGQELIEYAMRIMVELHLNSPHHVRRVRHSLAHRAGIG